MVRWRRPQRHFRGGSVNPAQTKQEYLKNVQISPRRYSSIVINYDYLLDGNLQILDLQNQLERNKNDLEKIDQIQKEFMR